MNADRWRRVEAIFGEAIERPPAERAALLEERCGSDANLRAEVESLLAAHASDGFLGELAVTADLARELLGSGATPSVPERLGPYDVLGMLGRGGMGVVYRARHRETGELAAVKTVAVASAHLLASVRREVHALARLRHPGIVRILDEGVHEGVPWYAMEVLDGTPLRERAQGDLTEALTLVRSLCEPLAFLHGEGIVHRDLKPDNVLVLPSGAPVLVDFGLAASFAGAGGREALDVLHQGGTAAYMSPEQILGEPVDARADLYALGCVLYELLTGRPPFVAASPDEVARAHLEREPAAPSSLAADLPPALDDLVLRLLAKQPADRVGHAGAVALGLLRLGAGALAADAPRPRAYLYRARFAGREGPMAEARGALARLSGGRGGLLIVEGESGVGKTRLALQVAREAAAAGTRVLAGECPPHGSREGAVPLAPLRAPLQGIADHCRERGPDEARRVLAGRGALLAAYEPAIAALPGLEREPEPPELGPNAARLRLFTALADAFGTFAAAGPVALVLDDLQWADELTLGWLAHALRARQLERRSLLVVATVRTEEAGSDVRALAESQGATRLRLGRLEEAGVASMVGDMLGLAPPPRRLSVFLSDHSEGNPFFVAEYLRAAVDEGLLWRDDKGSWQTVERPGTSGDEYERLGLPRSLRALVERRLEGLPNNASAAVAAAAVAGREVSHLVLGPVSGLGEAALLEATGELLRRHVLEEPAPGRLRFAHDTLREVAYGAIDDTRRARLHRAAAEAIEAGAVEIEAGALGRHWDEAGERSRAAPFYLEAARSARMGYANAEAVKLFRSYLRCADKPASERLAARDELGNVLRIAGRTAESVAEFLGAVEEATALGDRCAESASAEGAGSALVAVGRAEEAVPLFERALEAARHAGHASGKANALMGLAMAFATRSDFERARRYFEKALTIQRAAGDLRGEGVAARNLGVALVGDGRPEEAAACFERALAIAMETGTRHAEGLALSALGDVRAGQGDTAGARPLLERALAVLREVGDRKSEGVALVNLATACADDGRVAEARSLYDEALALARDTGDRRGEGFALLDAGTLERRAGDLAEAAHLSADAEAVFLEIGDRLYVGLCACQLGHTALADSGDASAHLADARSLAAEIGAGPESPLGRALARLERAAAADAASLHRGELAADVPPALRPGQS